MVPRVTVLELTFHLSLDVEIFAERPCLCVSTTTFAVEFMKDTLQTRQEVGS